MSFVSHIVTSSAEVSDSDPSHLETQLAENTQSTSPKEDYPALEKIDIEEDEKKGIFRSIKQKVSSAFSKSEDVDLVEVTEVLSASPDIKENDETPTPPPPSSGFLSSIKQRVGGFFYSQPKSEDEQEVEEDIESKQT